MVVIRKYQEGDVFQVRIRSGDPLGGPVQDYPGVGWTMLDGDHVLACMGIQNAAPGIGNLWAFISDEARGHGVRMLKFARARLNEAFGIMRYHRLQCVIRADRPEYERWILMFGFEKEGVMRKATPSGDDLFLFARIE